MKLSLIITWGFGFAVAASGLFYVTQKVEEMEDHLNVLNKQISQEQENIHMLEAEWSYFNRPDRIQKLTEKLLPEMKPIEARQFVSVNSLPFRLPTANEGEFGNVSVVDEFAGMSATQITQKQGE